MGIRGAVVKRDWQGLRPKPTFDCQSIRVHRSAARAKSAASTYRLGSGITLLLLS